MVGKRSALHDATTSYLDNMNSLGAILSFYLRVYSLGQDQEERYTQNQTLLLAYYIDHECMSISSFFMPLPP